MPEPTPLAVRNVRGPKAEVMAAILNDPSLAPEDKAWLSAKVDAAPFAGVTVNAHAQTHEGALHLSASITKLFGVLLILSAILFLPSSSPAAVSSSNLVTYAATGGASTNNGTPVLIGTAYIATTPSFIISDGGTTATNAMVVYVQYGLDTNYFSTVATYTKAATNATDGVVTPGGITLRIYAQTKVVTTNSVTVGTKAVFTQ